MKKSKKCKHQYEDEYFVGIKVCILCGEILDCEKHMKRLKDSQMDEIDIITKNAAYDGFIDENSK